MFNSLTINNWRQFADIEIRFHDRLTVLTGANGAGKTTILHLLNRHWGWNIPYVSTPRFSKDGVRQYWAGFWDEATKEDVSLSRSSQFSIGRITYDSMQTAEMFVPENVTETYGVQIESMIGQPGVYVPSHRPLYLHQIVEHIPTKVDARQQIFDVYLSEMRNRFVVRSRVESPSFKLKQSLISLATFGYVLVHRELEFRVWN